MASRYYDRAGQEIDGDTWARILQPENQQVAADKIGNVTVSTVWLGLNHRFGEGPPLIFETLVFEGPLDGEMERYSTEAEALEGHAQMVNRVREEAS